MMVPKIKTVPNVMIVLRVMVPNRKDSAKSKDGSQSHTTCIENSPSKGFSMPPFKNSSKMQQAIHSKIVYTKKVPHIKSGECRKKFWLTCAWFSCVRLLLNPDYLQVNSAL